MEHTQGRGRQAEVLVDGRSLTVCDHVSPSGERMRPGVLEGVRFGYVAMDELSWDSAIAGNPSRRRQIDAVRAWSYVGYGRVVDIMPVVIDFGLFTMEDPNWSSDRRLIGRYVRVHIDRLDILPM